MTPVALSGPMPERRASRQQRCIMNLNNMLQNPEGRALVLASADDPLLHKPVWAVYRFQKNQHSAEAQASEVSDLATAQATAKDLNSKYRPGESYTFKVCRLAISLGPPGPPPHTEIKL